MEDPKPMAGDSEPPLETTLESGDGDGLAPMDKHHSSSSSSSDESDDDDGAEELEIEALEKSLAGNPMDYEAHVKYVRCLRKNGDIEKLRQARESMNNHFPLSPRMWQEWAKDEAALSVSPEACAEIEKLYERGVQEYLYVPLWCDYLDFVQEHDQSVRQCSPAGILKMRSLFERALTAAGLHVVEGNKIWESYKEFEQAILLTIGDDNNEEKVKQVQRIRSLFQRQLSVPLVDLRSTLMAYKLWEAEQGNAIDVTSADVEGIPPNVLSAFQKALEMYNLRTSYEDQLRTHDASDADKLQYYVNYIKFEEASGDPARVQVLYERAVSDCPISSDLWLAYTSYLDRTLKIPKLLEGVYSRATKNCTWVGDLWVRYMLSLERLGASEEKLSTVFEKSIQCVFPSFNEYLDLFLTRVDGLRRRISFSDAKVDGLHPLLIRETFQRAVEYLSPHMVSTNDILHLHSYWARLEASIGKDIVAARGVWETLLKTSGSNLEAWQSYIEMETKMGSFNEARSIYKRCYSKRFQGTGSEDICHSWLRFEREYGTLVDYDLALRKVTPRLQELMSFRIQQEPKTAAVLSAQKDSSSAKNASQKRKMAATSNDIQPSAKKRKDSKPKPTEASRDEQTRKPGNMIDAEVTDKVEKANFPSFGTITSADDQSAGDLKPNELRPNFYTDQCTAFISNINLQANENHLREFFGGSGGVTAIRVLKDKFTGKSRGLAYVDFIDDEHLVAAIAKDRHKLLGQKLSIARSDPKKSQKRAPAGGSSSRGRGRGLRSRIDDGGKGEISEAVVPESRGSDLRLLGKNTFAAPRSVVRPLGWTNKDPKIESATEIPKSNNEFREILLKK